MRPLHKPPRLGNESLAGGNEGRLRASRRPWLDACRSVEHYIPDCDVEPYGMAVDSCAGC